VPHAETTTHVAKGVGDVSRSVVGEDAFDNDAQPAIVGDGAAKEVHTGDAAFVREDLDVRDAGSIVDRDMHVFPARTADGVTAIAGDPVSDAHDARQLLHVQVDELAGALSLVSANGALRGTDPAEAMAREHARHR
jgi:hypothetical protein